MRFVKKILLLLLLSPTLPAFGQEYPSRPITLVVPFSAGGPGDVIARLLGSSMSATLKQPFVIENVVGAGGTIGTNRVAKAAPDGYTLLLMHVGQATAPALYAKLPFDPKKGVAAGLRSIQGIKYCSARAIRVTKRCAMGERDQRGRADSTSPSSFDRPYRSSASAGSDSRYIPLRPENTQSVLM